MPAHNLCQKTICILFSIWISLVKCWWKPSWLIVVQCHYTYTEEKKQAYHHKPGFVFRILTLTFWVSRSVQTFSLSQRWPLNRGLTAYCICDKMKLHSSSENMELLCTSENLNYSKNFEFLSTSESMELVFTLYLWKCGISVYSVPLKIWN